MEMFITVISKNDWQRSREYMLDSITAILRPKYISIKEKLFSDLSAQVEFQVIFNLFLH